MLALLLNPPAAIKLLLDCWVQHLPFVQDWPFPVLHAVVQLPQWALSVLVFVHAPLQATLGLAHAHLLLTQSGVAPPHVPHDTLPPQPSEAVLQFCPLRQACAIVFGWQAHFLLTQTGVEPVHVPHDTVPPHPSGAVSQFCPLTQASAIVFGLQVHLVGEPMHVSLLAHAVHRAASAHPLFTSVVTHLSPHFLDPAPQVPTTQAPA